MKFLLLLFFSLLLFCSGYSQVNNIDSLNENISVSSENSELADYYKIDKLYSNICDKIYYEVCLILFARYNKDKFRNKHDHHNIHKIEGELYGSAAKFTSDLKMFIEKRNSSYYSDFPTTKENITSKINDVIQYCLTYFKHFLGKPGGSKRFAYKLISIRDKEFEKNKLFSETDNSLKEDINELIFNSDNIYWNLTNLKHTIFGLTFIVIALIGINIFLVIKFKR